MTFVVTKTRRLAARFAWASGEAMRPIASNTDERIALEKLSAECTTHGTVPVVCPRCAGKAGGKAHRGTRSRHNRELKALGDARRVYDASRLMQALAEQTEDEKRFQALCDKLGASAEERAEMREDMIRRSLFRELADRAGWTPEQRLQVLSLLDPEMAQNVRANLPGSKNA
jgi:hypothetical protein